MGGALLQLVAYGAQDIYLSGKPQITFFKSVYKRHTNFALESIEQNSEDTPALNTRITYTISRNGDLLKSLWIQWSPYDSLIDSYSVGVSQGIFINTIANDLSHALLEQIEFEIGGQIIDRQYGKWLTIWNKLTQENPYSSQSELNINGQRVEGQFDVLYNKMAYTHTGISKSIKTLSGDSGQYGVNFADAPKECYIPLQFWFCRNPGLSIPLIALQYHDVKLNINIADLSAFLVLNTPITNDNAYFNINKNFRVFGEYVFLDTVERRQFAQNEHQYLIEQVQKKSSQNTSNIQLNFNQPIKELIFSGQPQKPQALANYNLIDQYSYPGDYNAAYDPTVTVNPLPPPFQYYEVCDGLATPRPIIRRYDTTTNSNNPPDTSSYSDATVQLFLNGKEQFAPRNIKHFTREQIWKYHTGSGGGSYGTIGVFSFALHPEEHQPSGTCNFSSINDARLLFKNIASNEYLNPLDIYAINYNILRVFGGMGGVIYSN